jgi:osmoprotectant transport system ATP-binding protein
MSIQLKNISKHFGTLSALQNIDFSFPIGKTTVLIGPSGCGKSTLIRIITGLIKFDEGELFINDEMLSSSNLYSIRRKLGYVIQDGGLFPHLTAKANVVLLAEYLDLDKTKIENRVEELCALTKFPKDGLNRFPGELSGGQKQRVSLMRALMLNPEILLLDEPLGALDPLIRYELQTDLKEIFTNLNKTVIFVTHDMSEASFFGDIIVLMKTGKIIQTGTVNDFIDSPKEPFVTKFITAQRSFINK